jgi:MYXO-CTERM domain-containing protein
MDEGRYGRAAELMGDAGGLELAPWQPRAAQAFYMWLSPRNTSGGFIVSHEDSWDLHFASGELMIGAYRASGEYVTIPTGVVWPDDGEFHHLTAGLDATGASPRVVVAVDRAVSAPIDIGFTPRPSSAPLRLGTELDGFLDELLIKNAVPPEPDDLFDRLPDYCPDGTACVEEVIHVTPRGFTHEVPVRFKSVYDATECTPTSPCPLVFDISGGNTCADDYDGPWAVAALVQAGFVVVTVDLYCEGDQDTRLFPHETSQLVAVKDYVLTDGAVRELISGPDYAATGCSHGAGTVAHWAMREEDHPARTYSRSTGGAGLCGHVAEETCPEVVEGRMRMFDVDMLDLEDRQLRALHEDNDLVGMIDEDVTRTREIARSWGVNLEGPVCHADGSYACTEEGLWAMTYASRRFRDVWERHQPPGQPSGYFVQDRGADCRHCAPPTSEAFRCGVCMLRHGRSAMEVECPECLTYDDPTIERGPPGELCPIEASWYTDPLASAADPDAGVTDAGLVADGSVDTVRPSTDGGCGCANAGAGARPHGWWWLVAAGLLLSRRRRSSGAL